MELLKGHFAAPQSALLRRFLFRQRRQLPGESVHQYVANLRGLASSCKFGALQDEMIRDQLIEHTSNVKVRYLKKMNCCCPRQSLLLLKWKVLLNVQLH